MAQYPIGSMKNFFGYFLAVMIAIAAIVELASTKREPKKESPEMAACLQVMAQAGVNMFDRQSRCEKVRDGTWPTGVSITSQP